jgi:hypothetical protein
MRPSELKAAQNQRVETNDKPLPVSKCAYPPISQEEARSAGVSICRWHGGLVRMTGEKDGRVFYCPKGREYWRFSNKNREFYKPISYSRKGIV